MAITNDPPAEARMEDADLELYNDDNEEHKSLRKVPGRLNWMLFAVCVVEMGERFVYNGISGPLQNYVQNPYPHNPAGIPGALGRGQSTGVALSNFFKFWAYFCTVIGAVVADQYLGKFKTIIWSTPIYIIGMIILVVTATPMAIKADASFGGLIAAMITIGLGTGGLKACIAPMCGEQSPTLKSYIRTNPKTGEREVVDIGLSSARVFMWYYWAANLGTLSSLGTTSLEKVHSFWAAYLLPLCVFIVVLAFFLIFSKHLVKVPPMGSPIVDATRTLMIVFREKSFAAASPTTLRAKGRLEKYKFATSERYTDSYVADIRSGMMACKYFVLLPFFWLVWIQIYGNMVAQAGMMDVGNTPNDLMLTLPTIFMLAFIPLFDIVLYPFLRNTFGIVLNPILRIFLGFMVASLGMLYTCVLQHFIYEAPSNSINLWVQTPAHVCIAISEIWVVITGLEVAFIKAPPTLRAFVSSIFWLTVAAGSILGIALSPVSKNPNMVWFYGAVCITAFIAGVLFYVWFRESIHNGTEMAGQGSVSGVLEGKVPDNSSIRSKEITIEPKKLEAE
jgi:POT family proton-dependent oligopeptide transporter